MREAAIPLGLLLLTLATPGCDRGEVVGSEAQPEAAVLPTMPASGHDSAPPPVTDVKPGPPTPRVAARRR